jgi:hypothetical protein
VAGQAWPGLDGVLPGVLARPAAPCARASYRAVMAAACPSVARCRRWPAGPAVAPGDVPRLADRLAPHRCHGVDPGAKYCSTALAKPAAITCCPWLLAAIEPSKGSVMNSGSTSAPGIVLGVRK